MILRLWRYIAGSYPPAVSILFAIAWAFGVSGLYAMVDPRGAAWRPGTGTVLAAVTLALDLLLMRIVDDIRDRDYDRINDPRRPLPRGVVRVADLLGLYVVLAIGIVLLNLSHAGLVLIAAQLAYAVLILFAHEVLRWPSGDRLLLTLLVSCPAQILLHLYLYAGYLHDVGHGADRYGALAIVIVVCATIHLEAAKKIVRTPRPGERSYVHDFGLAGTVGIAMGSVLVSSALLLAVIGPRWSSAGILVVLAPLALPALALLRFRRPEERWRATWAAYYVLLSFGTYALGGAWLAQRGGQLLP